MDGAIWAAHAALGRENGYAGHPVGRVACGLRAGGCAQAFQGGAIYWSRSTGAGVVKGAIRQAHAGAGWENGHLGYPVGNEVCGLRAGGCAQAFQGGAIYWSARTGAAAVDGAIRNVHAANGWENGFLGYPSSPVVCGLRGGGCRQAFQGGSVLWSPATGAVPVNGAIGQAFARLGWEAGSLGYPRTGESCGGGACAQSFQGGVLSWSARDGRVYRS